MWVVEASLSPKMSLFNQNLPTENSVEKKEIFEGLLWLVTCEDGGKCASPCGGSHWGKLGLSEK